MDVPASPFKSNIAVRKLSSARRGLLGQAKRKQRGGGKPKSTSKAAVKTTRPLERKRTVQYLSVCRDPKAYRAVVQAAPDTVIKTICNAALNVQRGERVVLNRPQQTLFRRHRALIDQLVSKAVPLARKRKVLVQRGGFIVPALLGIAIQALGPYLLNKLVGHITGDNKQ